MSVIWSNSVANIVPIFPIFRVGFLLTMNVDFISIKIINYFAILHYIHRVWLPPTRGDPSRCVAEHKRDSLSIINSVFIKPTCAFYWLFSYPWKHVWRVNLVTQCVTVGGFLQEPGLIKYRNRCGCARKFPVKRHDHINSLGSGKFIWNFGYLIFQIISVIDGWVISCELALRWMSLDVTDDQSTLVQVMAWCLQATSHYLSQCWPRSLSPYGITRPQ